MPGAADGCMPPAIASLTTRLSDLSAVRAQAGRVGLLAVLHLAALAILIAAGIEPTCDWLRRRHRLAPALVPALLTVPVLFTVWFVVAPWPRADVAGASAYIRANQRPGDGVTANHWEYAYYFRREMPDVSWLDCGIPPGSRRLWVAFTTPESEDRRRYGTQNIPPSVHQASVAAARPAVQPITPGGVAGLPTRFRNNGKKIFTCHAPRRRSIQ